MGTISLMPSRSFSSFNESKLNEKEEALLPLACLGVGTLGMGATFAHYAGTDISLTSKIGLLAITILLGVCTKYAYDIYASLGYENPERLLFFRHEARQALLSQTVKTHGWEAIFRHFLLSPEEFTAKLIEYYDHLQFREILQTNQMLTHLLTKMHDKHPLPYKYELEAPSRWRDKYKTETKGMSLNQIFDTFFPFIEELKKFNIINSDQEKTLRDFAQHKYQMDQEGQELEKRYRQPVPYPQPLPYPMVPTGNEPLYPTVPNYNNPPYPSAPPYGWR